MLKILPFLIFAIFLLIFWVCLESLKSKILRISIGSIIFLFLVLTAIGAAVGSDIVFLMNHAALLRIRDLCNDGQVGTIVHSINQYESSFKEKRSYKASIFRMHKSLLQIDDSHSVHHLNEVPRFLVHSEASEAETYRPLFPLEKEDRTFMTSLKQYFEDVEAFIDGKISAKSFSIADAGQFPMLSIGDARIDFVSVIHKMNATIDRIESPLLLAVPMALAGVSCDTERKYNTGGIVGNYLLGAGRAARILNRIDENDLACLVVQKTFSLIMKIEMCDSLSINYKASRAKIMIDSVSSWTPSQKKRLLEYKEPSIYDLLDDIKFSFGSYVHATKSEKVRLVWRAVEEKNMDDCFANLESLKYLSSLLKEDFLEEGKTGFFSFENIEPDWQEKKEAYFKKVMESGNAGETNVLDEKAFIGYYRYYCYELVKQIENIIAIGENYSSDITETLSPSKEQPCRHSSICSREPF